MPADMRKGDRREALAAGLALVVGTAVTFLGLVLAAAGYTVLSWHSDATGVNAGGLIVLGTAVSYAVIIVWLAEAAGRHDVRWFSFGQIAVAAVAVALVRVLLTPF